MRLHDGASEEPGRIAAAKDGDKSALEWLAQRWTPPIFRFAMRMLRHEEDARDATQETIVKALKNLHRYDTSRAFSTWMFSIARNTCIDEHRRRKRRAFDEPKEVIDPSPSPLTQVSHSKRAERLQDSLALLPPLYREVIVLYHFEHLKYTEIAETLDLPLGTVMNRIFRARKKLRNLYESDGGTS